MHKDGSELPTPAELAALDAIGAGILVFDKAGQVLISNAAAATTLRLSAEQIRGSSPLPIDWKVMRADEECQPADAGAGLPELVRRTPAWRSIHRLHAPGAEVRLLEVSALPLAAPEHSEAIVVTIVDTTERLRPASLAEDSGLSFESIVETAAEGFVTLDRKSCVTYVNPHLCELTGYRREDLLGKSIVDVDPGAQPALERMWSDLAARGNSRFETSMLGQDGTRLWLLVSATGMYDEHGVLVGSVGLITDLSGQKATEDVLDHLSLHDPLTDIPNRRLFQDRLEHALMVARRDGTTLALMVLDLDGFKQVNDSFGHACGDGVLRVIADRLKSVVRQSDTVARMGGDEFAVLLRMDGDESALTTTAHKIRDALRQPMTIDGHVVEVDVSIGIARSPLDGSDADALYRHADSAMYDAKRERAGYTVYTPRLEHALPNDVILARELRQALQRDELHIVYQPEIDLQSGQLVRVEALLRWQHPQRGLLRPDDFIPAAERTRVMAQVTRWVLSTVIRQLRTWTDTGWHVQVAVNLSAWDLRDSSLPEFIDRLLRRWQVDAALLAIETTETALIADPVRARETMNHLQALGIRLSLDDFGTGYSALSFIRDLPSQEIKIDQSFVRNVERDHNNAAIVGALVHLAHQLGRSIVAEGVETQEAYNLLKNLGCDTAEGRLMAQPMSPGELERWAHTRAAQANAPTRG